MTPNFLKPAGAGAADSQPDPSDAEDANEAPEPAEAEAGDMQPGELCIPVSALALPDDQEQMANPEPGDVVQLQVGAKVTRVEGENAYILPQTVNGQTLPEAKPEAPAPSADQQDAQQYGDLQDMARQMPAG